MLKKLGAFVLAISISVSFSGCKSEAETVEANQQPWIGSYMQLDEETGEIKTATVVSENETTVTVSFKSVRSQDEFSAEFKSQSSRYAVYNSDSRCIKFNLKSGNSVIAVDDIWINKDAKRNENWTGKYELIEDNETAFEYGDKKWNGEYTNPDTGINVSVYAITDTTVLLSYVTDGKNGKEKINIVCDIDGDSNCSYDKKGRTINVFLKKQNKEIEITDSYESEQEETGFVNLNGTYKAG